MNKWQFWLVPAIILIAAIAAFMQHDALVNMFAKSKPAPALAGPFTKAVYGLPDCDTAPEQDTRGTVNIILPDKFDGSKTPRSVNHGPKVPKSDPNTGSGQSGFNPNKPTAAEPFDVFVDWTSSPKQGYLLTRVLLTKGNKFSFYQNSDFFGVGRNDNSDATLCGAAAALSGTNPGQGQAQEIATFYIDLAKLAKKAEGTGVDFTVGLTGSNGPGSMTPVLIDPKVINDGGGTRNTG
jgi:hypothetical protein